MAGAAVRSLIRVRPGRAASGPIGVDDGPRLVVTVHRGSGGARAGRPPARRTELRG
ncbi:hypothetical protein GCM10010365_18810 [Streptomyces poonensis]|uniref:Uncharacterized protein n=1 Tax=Streptomyces poonensis TaxID=68255 RepID=A0A918PE37_9ACTN|nr:hypothetical protein GCM10010365_18810 [Streptomyces poonensis]GLJ92131.1 hypothetical protein GCM10017589_47400 [Streptomyces poonensis]